MHARRPVLQGRTEVEQIQKIFKLCGSVSTSRIANWHALLLRQYFTTAPYACEPASLPKYGVRTGEPAQVLR
jgi:hypothetical protein